VVVVNPGLPIGPKAITGDEYLRVELAAVEVSRSGLAGRRTQLKIFNVPAQRSFTLVCLASMIMNQRRASTPEEHLDKALCR
jgi:hypothetical protein